MSVRELVEMGRSPYTGFWGRLGKEDKQVVEESIALVRIENLASRMVHTLSDGERQKVMIAKALAQQTPVVLLDEPTAFLDYPSRGEVMQLLLNIAHEEHKTVLLSTHDLDLALHTADRLWLFEKERGGEEKDRGGEEKEEKTNKGKETNAKSTLISGTPQELVSNGSISRFAKGA